MSRYACLLLFWLGACSPSVETPQTSGGLMWFEGARLIVGDGSAPIENAAFLVEGDTFIWVGPQSESEPPEGGSARRFIR